MDCEATNQLDPYEQLAQTLYELPHGFELLEDGTHIRVLQWIFTPEEAELASKICLEGETAEELAERTNKKVNEITAFLNKMISKGQIVSWMKGEERTYALVPFFGGICRNPQRQHPQVGMSIYTVR